MSEFSFGKRERLAKRPQFEHVMNRGRKRRIETYCTVFFLPNGLDRKRLGIIASKKIGNAVVRNQAKRKIREVFRHIKKTHRTGYGYRYHIRKGFGFPARFCSREKDFSIPSS